MSPRTRPSRFVYLLGALTAGAIAAAVLVVGPPSQSVASERTVTVAEGVVQSTVSGAGNVRAASELDLGFKTSGVVSAIDVSEGQQVAEGQLLAELNPTSAEVALEQARATLKAAEANLAQVEEDGGETSAPASSGQGSSSGQGTGGQGSSGQDASGRGASSTSGQTGAAATTTTSAATREADIASARAAVRSDRLAVEGDEQAVADTRMYAPESGTIVSLAGEVGEEVSATGTTRAAAASSSSGGSSSGKGASAGTGAGAGASSAGGSAAGGSSSGSSSAAFAVLSDLSAMQLVVPLSESEVGSVRDGQPATVTIEALEGRKLAAHVIHVATLPTSNSGVVSYDVTFALDQLDPAVRPGMSATAEVVVKQAEGVNVPTSAITAGTVEIVSDGRQAPRRVVTGLAGDSSTIVLSGLKAGERVALPAAQPGSGSGSSGLAARLGRGGLGGAGAGGGAVFFGGGGGALRGGP